jgi:hypothetical protein
MKTNEWARLLAYVTRLVNQQVLLQNEYLAAENRISPSAAAQATAADRSSEIHAGGYRETPRTQGVGASRVRGETRHDSGVVPTTDRAEV